MPTVKRRTPIARAVRNFPAAACYTSGHPPHHATVHEPAPAAKPPAFTERHLQSIWFDSQLRPAALVTLEGEQLTVQEPGRWNLEAGPDFLDAVLVVGPDRRTLRGDVEVHIHPSDWTHHGHRDDPLYRNVIAHICYWPGRAMDDSLPHAAVQVALKTALDADPAFFFESIDITAYPYTVPPPSHPDQRPPLAALPAADATRFLTAAGQERLRQKSEVLRASIDRVGEEQTLFEFCVAALGYQHNRGVCRRLARCITVERLRRDAAGDPLAAYALLLGVSGLMPQTAAPTWDAETRRYVRKLWDTWWKMQSRWDVHRVARRAWRLTGIRPQNHPVRRLAAAAMLFARPASLATAIRKLPAHSPQRWFDGVRALMAAQPAFAYWQSHLSFGGRKSATPVALIGEPRQASIILNVLIPYLAAVNTDVNPLLDAAPTGDSNQIVRQCAHLVFGPDHNPAIYAGGLQQQGLIQIFHDFCLPNRLADLASVAQTT